MSNISNPGKFLSDDEIGKVQAAIEQTEKETSAEIKLIIAKHCWDNIKRKASTLFKKHNLHKTKDRNCVLILIITTNREFLIYGDQGIHEKVGQDFWDQTRNVMAENFKQNAFGDGICSAIKLIGEKLKLHFPYNYDDKNEISNEVTYEG
jgi:uncharacterized membrane protein